MKMPAPIEYLQHLFKEEAYQKLVDAANQLLADQPDHVRALYWRACAFMRLEQLEEALNDLDKAIDLYDEYADAFSQRGVLFFHKGELELALEDMNEAVKLEPENPYRYSSRAYIKSRLDQVESAIEDYQKAIELDPEDSVAHNNLGLLHEQLGYKTKAQNNFEQADRLMVNEEGELVEHVKAIPEPIAPERSMDQMTLSQILKHLFTTRIGFTEYLRYLKKMLWGRK
ncbi:MAG: tetratricopeptide repeat protein [Bacteroidetes bacterium]|nr:tetratricopeptide repeat protein [Bacteroidota bacterium]